MIYLHTLGDTLIKVGEKEIRPTSPMLFAVLLYLGMERGRRVPRTALQELLFPNADERSGAHSLRQLLYKLRQLGVPIDGDSSSVVLDADQVHDDAALDLELSNGQAKNAAKYALGLLPDYSPRLSERYEEWLEQQRTAVAAKVRRQLVAAMSASRESIDWKGVERFAHLVLQIDPFNEEATMALAESTALLGSKAEAISILSRYERETGRSDLNLATSVLRRRISQRPTDVSAHVQSPFVGRDSDCQWLRMHVNRIHSGQSRLVVISAEPGIGKTRLVEETAALTRLEGLAVEIVRCHSHRAGRPLGPFLELVRALLNRRGALGISPESLAHLRLLVSHKDETQERRPDVADNSLRSDVLLSALHDLLSAVTAERPLVIVLEDIHWVDDESLRDLGELVFSTNGDALAFILTTRSLEPLRRNGLINEMTSVRKLGALAVEPMLTLSQHLLSGRDDETDDVRRWCVRTASGNPLLLQSLCQHYRTSRVPYSIPSDIISVITTGIEQLPPPARRILEISALLGPHGSLAALKSLSECRESQFVDSIQYLEEKGYLRLAGC